MCCRKLTLSLRFSVSGIFVLLLTQCGLSSGKGVPTTQSYTLSYDKKFLRLVMFARIIWSGHRARPW